METCKRNVIFFIKEFLLYVPFSPYRHPFYLPITTQLNIYIMFLQSFHFLEERGLNTYTSQLIRINSFWNI